MRTARKAGMVSSERIPFLDRRFELAPHCTQLAQPPVDVRELLRRECPDLATGDAARVAGAKDARKLVEREADRHGAADHADALDRGRCVRAITGRGPRGPRQHAFALVVAKGVGAHARCPRQIRDQQSHEPSVNPGTGSKVKRSGPRT